MTSFFIGVFFRLVALFFQPKPPDAQPANFDESSLPKTREGERAGKGYGTFFLTPKPIKGFGFDYDPIRERTSKK